MWVQSLWHINNFQQNLGILMYFQRMLTTRAMIIQRRSNTAKSILYRIESETQGNANHDCFMLQPFSHHFPRASCFATVISTWRNTISASCGVSQPTHRTFQSSSCCSRFFWITCIDTKRLMPSDTTGLFLPKEPVVRHNFLLNRWKQWLTKSFTHIITCQDITGFLNSAGHTCRNSNFVSHRGIRFKTKSLKWKDHWRKVGVVHVLPRSPFVFNQWSCSTLPTLLSGN